MIALVCVAMVAALLPFQNTGADAAEGDGLFPWQIDPALPEGVAPIGTGFKIAIPDLVFILEGIKISDNHTANSTPGDPCAGIMGPGPNQIPNVGTNGQTLPFGMRTLSGICNNLMPGQALFGTTDEPFLRHTTADWRPAEPFQMGPPSDPGDAVAPFMPDPCWAYVPGPTCSPTSYASFPNPAGAVIDSEPRIISNLIVDQTGCNPAAAAVAGDPAPACPSPTYDIENVAPDEGLSAPFNSTFIFFGQFFDHGLDLTTKTGETVFVPLQADDPLFVPGSPTNFMVLSRAQFDPVIQPVNQTSPFVDQNQTYTSHPSQQVFQREYEPAVVDPDGAGPKDVGDPVDTGRLLEGVPGGLATWADIKAQALTLGFVLDDHDVLDIPLMAADLYGNFIPGPSGYPQMVDTVDGILGNGNDMLVEGNPLLPIPTPATAGRVGAAWLVDIAHEAVPGMCDPDGPFGPTPPIAQIADADGDLGITGGQGPLGCEFYDDEMLAAHFVCGDGRCNENIALSAIHHVFHSEHNRLADQVKDTLTMEADPAFLAEWEVAPGVFNGQRIFQAAKFGTEMQYQHLAFEEFARTVQPFVNEFVGYDTTIDARIAAEFAHVSYRFGHSMLPEMVQRFNTTTGAPDHITLIEAFLNPPEFFDDGAGGTLTPEEAAGGLIAGSTVLPGQHIDEFIVSALQSALLGLPLDLATINIARGRDTGIPRLNDVRATIFALTNGSPIFAPYANWFEFGLGMGNPDSLVNFIAAYGTYPDILACEDPVTGARGTVACLRAAAAVAMADVAFMTATGPTWGVTPTGVDDIDMWIGGLAEKKEIFGGLLGSTHNFVFELQMENLQNGDRFYYLHRLAGLPMLQSLEGNSFSELIERNTTVELLPANAFAVPSYTFNLENAYPVTCGGIVDDPDTPYDETALLIELPAAAPILCEVRYTDAEHVNIQGRDGANDRIHSGEGDDSVKGHGGDDILEGFGGNDSLVGGEGNDILTDTFGDDDLKGGPGHDAIHGGLGFDLLQGGFGDDLIVIGSDPGESLAGPGDDLLIGGDSFDVLFGDDGDDWLMGGGQADLVQGDAGAPFENNPVMADGHDVLDGGGGNDDFHAEGGDDIMLVGEGIDRFEGMDGHDWVIQKNDPFPGDIDLERLGILPPDIDNVVDRYDLTESISGYELDDVLKGNDGLIIELLGLGEPEFQVLDADGIARIIGLAALLPPGATSFDGNIILGGGGNDEIHPRGGNDIIDGDKWLDVELVEVGGAMRVFNDPMAVQAEIFSGTGINPGDLDIRRMIKDPIAPAHADVDTVVFRGPLADYELVVLDGVLRVVHTTPSVILEDGFPVTVDDGNNRITNVEMLQFADQTIPAPTTNGPTGLLRVTTSPAVPGQISIDGVPRNDWGLDWVKMPPGTYEVCYGPVIGFTQPLCDTAVVTVGNVTEVVGEYTQNAILRIRTNPPVPSTITVDGVAMDDWEAWTEFEPGEHTVCFGAVAGWGAPPCQNVVLAPGLNPEVVGNFVAGPGVGPGPHGLLRVTTNNGSGGGVQGRIIVDGIERDEWALTWMKIPAGLHEVCFGDLNGWATPECQEVTVVNGAVSTVEGVYVQHGTLQVTTSPPTQSTIFVDSIRRNDWGMWTSLPAGEYEVCFEHVGAFMPSCSVETVNSGANTHRIGS